jgi:hypothetical protein
VQAADFLIKEAKRREVELVNYICRLSLDEAEALFLSTKEREQAAT